MKIDLNNATLDTIISCLESSKKKNDQAKRIHGVELFPGIDEALETIQNIVTPKFCVDTGYEIKDTATGKEVTGLLDAGYEIVEEKEL